MRIGALLTVPLLAAVCLSAWHGWQEPKRPATPQEPADADKLVPGKLDPALLQQLKWISGTWVCKAGKVTIEEHWRPLQGTLILGSSHTFDPEVTRFFEQLYIGYRGGYISYVAIPAGDRPTSFELARVEDGLMVFENPKHDHPQRIRYERTEDGMKATISQMDGSRATAFPFKQKK